MDISRLKKLFAGVSAAAIMLSQGATAFAAYSDVPAGIWYESAVEALTDAGVLDGTQTNFRGQDNANRAEFVKLIVELNGGVVNEAPALPSFDDVATGAWYYEYMEEAGTMGWVKGDGSCYGKHPCYARPGANINRAEAAALIVRAFNLEQVGSAPTFVDNLAGKWYTADIQTAADHCVLQGDDSTGRVRPGDNMNRAEMAVMLNRVNEGLTYGEDCGTAAVSTPAVKSVVATSATVVEVAFNSPVDETVAKDKSHYTVTGAPELPIDSVALTSSDTVELTLVTAMDAGKTYTLTVVDMQTTDGKKFNDSKTFAGYTTVVQGDGTLEVTLSAKNPVGDTIPKGSQGVVFTSVDLTATGDDVTIENLTVLHEGFGAASEFSGVYAIIDGARVTRKRTIDNQSYTATIRFTKPLVVAAGKTVTLQLSGDLNTDATASSEHALTIELASDFVSNAKAVKGNFPLRGKSFRVAAVTSGTVSIQYRSVTPSSIKVGDKAATIGKWELSVNSTEDQTIYSMTLQNDGTTGDGDFTNIAVKRSDGTIITKTVAMTTGDYATLVFDPPFPVLEGDRITMSVIADIAGGAAKNIKMHFDETGDIFAVGSLYGYGVNGQLYGSAIVLNEDTLAPATVTIDAGQFTISIDGPVTTQYTRKDKNAVLANVTFATGGEDIDVEQLFIMVHGQTATGASFLNRATGGVNTIAQALEKVELRNTTTGRTISGVQLTGGVYDAGSVAASGTYQMYRFDDFIVTGTQKYEFRVNFIDNSGTSVNAVPANGDKFKIHICGEATNKLVDNNLVSNTVGCALGGFVPATTLSYQMKISGVSTNDRVGDYRPGGTITGNSHEIKTANLTVTTKATATADTTVSNAKNVNLLRFEARAGEAADLLVTDMIFMATIGNANVNLVNGANYALWVDTNDDGVVDTILQKGVASQSSQVTFDKITGGGYVVPKSKSVVFEVHADISSSITGATPQMQIQFASGSTFISAEQVSDGSSLSGIGVKSTSSNYDSGSSASDIQVSIVASTIYSLRTQGDLYVTKSSTPVRTRQLLGGTLADEILRLQFHAEYEDIDVTDIALSSATAISSHVDRLELYKVGATTPFAIASVGGCGSDTVKPNSMCAKLKNQEFVVAKGTDANVLVRPRMRTDTDGAVSKTVVTVYVDSMGTTSSTTSGSIRARGLLSSNQLTGQDTDATPEGEVFVGVGTTTATSQLVGSVNNVVLSKVTSITNADPNANGTAIPSGVRDIGQFKFATAAASNGKSGPNKWTLTGVVFNVNATNVKIGTDNTAGSSVFKLYNKLDPTVFATCTAGATATSGDAASGALLVTCADLQTASLSATPINASIDPGSDLTFVLQADITNTKISNGSTSTLQVSLQGFDTQSATTFGTAAGKSHIAWSDKDNAGDVPFLWIEYPTTSVNGTSYNG
ncbi:MAG: S-layer homology domain-containing protein [Candidatus Peribacteraceae bacterium]|nr:S-layer homology domain-containing protein [Candidatus Peribacteraceae bacterium]